MKIIILLLLLVLLVSCGTKLFWPWEIKQAWLTGETIEDAKFYYLLEQDDTLHIVEVTRETWMTYPAGYHCQLPDDLTEPLTLECRKENRTTTFQ